MGRYEHHVFVCTNRRAPDDKRGCCAAKDADKVLDRLKGLVHEAGLKGRVRVNASGCIDNCACGVSIVVYPEGVWYGRVREEDVEEIVRSHLIGGRPVDRLKVELRPSSPQASVKF